MALHWITKSPYPLTKIAITHYGTYRIERTVNMRNGQLWSVTCSGKDGWTKVLGSTFATEEAARGAAFDDAQETAAAAAKAQD